MPADDRIEHASVVRKANIYFDGRCVSHTVYVEGGARTLEPLHYICHFG